MPADELPVLVLVLGATAVFGALLLLMGKPGAGVCAKCGAGASLDNLCTVRVPRGRMLHVCRPCCWRWLKGSAVPGGSAVPVGHSDLAPPSRPPNNL